MLVKPKIAIQKTSGGPNISVSFASGGASSISASALASEPMAEETRATCKPYPPFPACAKG